MQNFERKVAGEIANATSIAYITCMADFIEYLRQRRAQIGKSISRLEAEMQALDIAESVYRSSQQQKEDDNWPPAESMLDEPPPVPTDLLEGKWRERLRPKSIKEMIGRVLDQTYPGGLTAIEVLKQIQRNWRPELERTTLSPQLSRLKHDGVIKNVDGKWFLVVDNENTPPPDMANGVQE